MGGSATGHFIVAEGGQEFGNPRFQGWLPRYFFIFVKVIGNLAVVTHGHITNPF
jgi:hypothetical protein